MYTCFIHILQHYYYYGEYVYLFQLESSAPNAKKPKLASVSKSVAVDLGEQRTFRKSTHEVSAEHQKRLKEAKKRRNRATKTQQRPAQRRMTQQELLEEAKWTELENKASLEAFTRLEEEKRQVKEKKRVIKGPVIRFHSVTMPMISPELEPSQDQTSTSEFSTAVPPSSPSSITTAVPQQESSTFVVHKQTHTQQQQQQQTKYCRNFLVFTDTTGFPDAYFPTRKPPKPKRTVCPVTGLPAKYIDPITGTPYATPQAFKIIRTRYVRSAEEKCEKRLIQLSSWLEEKKRKKKESRIY